MAVKNTGNEDLIKSLAAQACFYCCHRGYSTSRILTCRFHSIAKGALFLMSSKAYTSSSCNTPFVNATRPYHESCWLGRISVITDTYISRRTQLQQSINYLLQRDKRYFEAGVQI